MPKSTFVDTNYYITKKKGFKIPVHTFCSKTNFLQENFPTYLLLYFLSSQRDLHQIDKNQH